MPSEARSRLSSEQNERFRRLAWPWLPLVVRTAEYLCGSTAEAEDLAQETMLKAARSIDRFREGTEVKAWLLTILRRTHIDAVRARKARPHEVAMEAASDAAAPDDAPATHDADWHDPAELMERFEDQAVIDALKTLPEEIRWTLLLTDVEQLDHADAAGVLEVPVGTVKSRVHRGRKMLRDRLFEVARERGWVKEGARSGGRVPLPLREGQGEGSSMLSTIGRKEKTIPPPAPPFQGGEKEDASHG